MKPGRNDPCPCGSGKKYKHCCYAKDSAELAAAAAAAAAAPPEEEEDVEEDADAEHRMTAPVAHGHTRSHMHGGKGVSAGIRPRTMRGAQRGT